MRSALAGLALLGLASPAWAETALNGCIRRDAPALDDRVSNARDVADTIIRNCISQITKGQCIPGTCQDFFITAYLPAVTTFILRQRAAARLAQ